MKRLKTIKYISETSIEDLVSDVLENNRDVNHVIQAALEARKEFGLKVQEFIDKLAGS
ncbi:hypothetical protein GRF59_14805 [Paenibacillus sp. HJL G12]|uniref:Uncharacterized protein n=1 Tax=Paenibacillus dendrobii TaxID=2691084 RepID=A0A7X3IJ41_9BACL|nr:hypothetical protein [Paenibacillus dendrobii]MWV44889.1 hypothetical protein [Paenibacillus dendrobii]